LRFETPAERICATDPRQPPSASDAIDRVLDKGIVIDQQRDMSLGGIQLIAFDAHIVVVSIETYLYRGSGWPPSEAVTGSVEEYLRRVGPDPLAER
jgi:hypothetical protein